MTNTTITAGSTVTLHYVGTLDDGTEFDNSHKRGEPMTVETGQGNLITGFENALEGMTAGETKTVTLSPDQAYGEPVAGNSTSISRSVLPDDFPLEEGTQIPLMSQNGHPAMGIVTKISDDSVDVDLNHPLAGKTLTFAIDVISVNGVTEATDTLEDE